MSTPPAAAEPEQSLISHLVELRQRLVRAAIAVLLVFLALSPFMSTIYDLMSAPIMATLPPGSRLIATSVTSPFLVPLKATLMVAFVLALPFVLYQAWAFVAPGLYQHERRLAVPIIVSSFVMFLAGVAFCYFIVFRLVFRFIAGFAPMSVAVAPDIDAYFGFVLGMFLAFGLTFETPIVIVVLVRLGVVTVDKLKAFRPYFIVGAFIIAAVVTPPDVTSQLLLAVPLVILYEIGLRISTFVAPRPRSGEPAPAAGGTEAGTAAGTEAGTEAGTGAPK